jgi:antirestriction protein ArdC
MYPSPPNRNQHDFGVAHDSRDNTAAYLASCLKVLKQEKRAIITGAARAKSVANYLHELQESEAAA